MIKEQEIVKNFLMSNFHWVKIDTEGGFESGGSCRRIFKGNVCPRARFWDWSMDDDKSPKHWKSESECSEWLPQNILHKSIEEYKIDKSGKSRRYQVLSKDIDADTKLLLQIHQGSISGVGYYEGWEIHIGFMYKNFIFKMYDYKSSKDNYELECLYDIDYIRSIDFSNMKELNSNLSIYMSEYYAITDYESTSLKDMTDVLKLAMEGDTLTFSSHFMDTFSERRGISSSDGCRFIRETLCELNPKKIIMEDCFDVESNFDIPDSLESIELKFKKSPYSDGVLEQFLDCNKELGKYLNCSDDCDKLKARELYNNQLEQSETPVNLWFEYKELSGYVYSNEYQLELLKKFYKDSKYVTINVGDASFDMPIKKFWDSIRIEKKIKYAGKMSKAHDYFGEKVGFTSWFPKKCDVHPKYKFEKSRK